MCSKLYENQSCTFRDFSVWAEPVLRATARATETVGTGARARSGSSTAHREPRQHVFVVFTAKGIFKHIQLSKCALLFAKCV